MIIKVRNTRELVVGLLGIFGELPKPKNIHEMFSTDYDIKKATLSKEVSLLKKRDIVSARKGFDGIRLKAPEGLVRLGVISEPLYLHYMVLSNGHKNRTGRGLRDLTKRNRDSALFAYRAGAYVDNLRLSYVNARHTLLKTSAREEDISSSHPDKYFERDGRPASLAELTHTLPAGEKFFYSSRIVKDILNDSGTRRIMLSKANGILCANGNTYSVYYVQEGTAAYSKTHEEQMRYLLREIHRNAYGKESEKYSDDVHPNGHAIFIAEDIEFIPELIHPKKRKYLTPGAVYGDYYILPSDERGRYVLNILSTERWEIKILDALYYDDELTLSRLSDGQINGVPSWEFMTCNFKKAEYILRNGSRHIHLICYPWQQKILEAMFPDYQSDFMIMGEKEQRELENAICR